jgi:SAM-dependent methyltransferase
MAFPEAMLALQAYIRPAEALAALGANLGVASGKIAPSERLRAKLDGVLTQYEPNLLDGLSKDELEALHGFVRASLLQMLHLIELTANSAEGWNYTDEGLLQAQGRASRLVTRLITDYAHTEQALGQMLEDDGDFLDVGSGVGWISLSMAMQWPKLRSTGIDILGPALALAQQNLTETEMSGRVSFRNQNVIELSEQDIFNITFIPLIFIPETIFAEALAAVRRSLKSDGWLFAAAYRIPEDPRQAALNDLKTTLSGGRVWQVPELIQVLESAGFTQMKDIGEGSPLHLIAARCAI